MSVNIDNTKRAYAAFGEGDIATLTELIAPDCIWHVGGRSQLTGDYVGQEQILGYFAKLYELTDGTFSATLTDIGETEAGLATCIVTLHGRRNGTKLETRMVEIGQANAAGQVAECWWYAEDAYAVDEFFGPAQIVLPEQSPVSARV
ncbi:MAG: nuclear transport factor 2 family protein [Frankiaceae bacterium]|nr:nuclear transport factor 2 family protein [Frankiaceae bacterium]